MSNFHNDYGRFCTYLRGFDLISSLIDVWSYSGHVIDGQPLQVGYAVGLDPSGTLKANVHPWDLDVLTREIILNAGTRPNYSLKWWTDLAAAINHLRHLDGEAFLLNRDPQTDVMFELHRLAHRQFPWQMGMGVSPMMRVFKIFGEKTVSAIVERELGMSTQQFLCLGMAIAGHFIGNWGMSTNQDYDVLKISREASTAFFNRIACPLDELKAQMADLQSCDQDWLYVWNPLEATPLVRIDSAFPDRVLCPIPRHLLRRASSGIFYDLVKSSDFDNPFGSSFQTYVGELIGLFCKPPTFSMLAEEPYYVGKNKRHGVDWILSDKTGHVFIESKTKRLTIGAKTLSDTVGLNADLATMAKAIVQHYRNIRDALDGKTRWKPDQLPIFPLILTLEDWFIFSPRVTDMLKRHVRRMLSETHISEDVLEKMPYTIASAHELELGIQVVAQRDIYSVMSSKTEGDQRSWSFLPLLTSKFSEEMRNVDRYLFASEWDKLLPEMPDGTSFADIREAARKTD
jgi:hypothetical protein